VIANGVVYAEFGFGDDDEHLAGLYALDAKTGTTLWWYYNNGGFGSDSAVVVNGMVYIGYVNAFGLPNQ